MRFVGRQLQCRSIVYHGRPRMVWTQRVLAATRVHVASDWVTLALPGNFLLVLTEGHNASDGSGRRLRIWEVLDWTLDGEPEGGRKTESAKAGNTLSWYQARANKPGPCQESVFGQQLLAAEFWPSENVIFSGFFGSLFEI